MFQQELIVKNATGLHARPASDLTKLCQKYKSDITILAGSTPINPKSIISIMAGGVTKGTKITLQVEGPDEALAGKSIAAFIESLKE